MLNNRTNQSDCLSVLTSARADMLAMLGRLSRVNRATNTAKREARKGWRAAPAIVVGPDGSATVVEAEARAKGLRKVAAVERQQAGDTIARLCGRMAGAWARMVRAELRIKRHSAAGAAVEKYQRDRFARLSTAIQRVLGAQGGIAAVREYLNGCVPPADWGFSAEELRTEVRRAQVHALVGAGYPKGWVFSTLTDDAPVAKKRPAAKRRRVTRS